MMNETMNSINELEITKTTPFYIGNIVIGGYCVSTLWHDVDAW